MSRITPFFKKKIKSLFFFIKILLIFIFFLPSTLLCQSLQRFTFQHQQMGTQFQLILYAENKGKAESIAKQCFKEIDQLNKTFSDYRSDSEISQLSASAGSGKSMKVSTKMWDLIKISKKMSKISKGAFDITIGPLSKLWRSMFRRQVIFDVNKILTAKMKINYKFIKRNPFRKSVKLKHKGMRLDAGGIAKGYTVDAIAQLLQQQGIQHFLIDGGGDIYAAAPPPNKEGWSVQITVLNEQGEKTSKTISLKHQAIASSGDTYRYLEWQGKRYSHIIDPRTGYGVINQKIINVIAPNCTIADAAASVLSVLTFEEAERFLRKMKQIEFLK